MTIKEMDQLGAQPTDPPWARLLFLLLQGRDGQCWRAVLLAVPLLLFVVALVGMIAALLSLGGSINSAIAVGSLTVGGALALRRRQNNSSSR